METGVRDLDTAESLAENGGDRAVSVFWDLSSGVWQLWHLQLHKQSKQCAQQGSV